MTTHLFSGSLHHFSGNGVDFIVHLHSSFLAAANLYQKHPEVCTSKIQSQKVTIFYIKENIKKYREVMNPAAYRNVLNNAKCII